MSDLLITFLEDSISIKASSNDKITDIAKKAGISINVPCGCNGICKKCLVRLHSGEVNSRPEIEPDIYLACCTKPLTDCSFEIIYRDNYELYSQNNSYKDFIKGLNFEKSITKKHFSINDLETLKNKYDLAPFENDIKEYLPEFTMVYDSNSQVISIEKGNTEKENFGLAIDLGTTTIDILLVDLNHGTVIANQSIYNQQRQYGEDIITRIIHIEKNKSLEELQKVVVESINNIIRKFEHKENIKHQNIYKILISGNTTMSYILSGHNPAIIRREDESDEYKKILSASKESTGILASSNADIKLIPSISAFVGGDITSGIISSRLHKSEKLTLLVDIGTNGELVLGNSEWMVACSCSAGPAFEGTNISCGCRAIPGAINKISINKDDLSARFSTINNEKPIGICGSAVIDLVSEMFKSGIIDRQGALVKKANPCLKKTGNVFEYIIAPKEIYDIERDITINENDLKNIIRAKAAVFSGINLLLKSVDLTFEDIDKLIMAGSFGQFINFENAVNIGLLPEINPDKFKFKGNTSLKGALKSLLDSKTINIASEITNNVTYIDLSKSSDFMNFYTASLFLPHTDLSLFSGSAKMDLDNN